MTPPFRHVLAVPAYRRSCLLLADPGSTSVRVIGYRVMKDEGESVGLASQQAHPADLVTAILGAGKWQHLPGLDQPHAKSSMHFQPESLALATTADPGADRECCAPGRKRRDGQQVFRAPRGKRKGG
jgi:hypothetical protein